MAGSLSGGSVPRTVKFFRSLWMTSGCVGMGLVLYFVLFPPRGPVSGATPESTIAAEPKQAVNLRADGKIEIASGTVFASRIATTLLETRTITDPLVTVSGIVVARILPGTGELSDRWHFNTPELGTAHANWLKSNSEVVFSRNQLEKTKELASAQISFLELQLKRLEANAKSGAIPEKEILAARSDLLKAQLQGQKDVFSAESALRVAENSRVSLERELSQRGIEPVVFGRGVEQMVLVSANVPETKISLIREGQACRVRFFAYPEKSFDAHVETLSTTVTHELRTLRVLFDLSDPEELLIPGMFAEVELGTDEREALVIPAQAIIHVGQADYVLVSSNSESWLPREVRVGEFRNGSYEILRGLEPGQTIITSGAILLKPKVVESLTRPRNKVP